MEWVAPSLVLVGVLAIWGIVARTQARLDWVEHRLNLLLRHYNIDPAPGSPGLTMFTQGRCDGGIQGGDFLLQALGESGQCLDRFVEAICRAHRALNEILLLRSQQRPASA